MSKWTAMNENPAKEDFQTPPEVCEYMCNMIPSGCWDILEPTPGENNLVWAIMHEGSYSVTCPKNFFDLDPALRFDCVVMNPPFSAKSTFGIPEGLDKLGMRMGYYFLSECMLRSDRVIALMPWFTITDSDVRLRHMKAYGLKSITALPRKTFKYARIQTCVFELHKGWKEETIFRTFEFGKK